MSLEKAPQTLTRAKLAKAVAQDLGLSRAKLKPLLEELLSQVINALSRGEGAKISVLVTLTIDKKSRPGRNPKTLDPCVVSARRVVTFKAGNKLKSMIQDRIDQKQKHIAMSKLPDQRYYTISDISNHFNIEPYKIRYWEKKTNYLSQEEHRIIDAYTQNKM